MQNTTSNTIKLHFTSPNTPPSRRLSHPRQIVLNSLVSSRAIRCSEMLTAKKSRACAKTPQTASDQFTCCMSHPVATAPHMRTHTRPTIIDSKPVSSMMSPFLMPITKPNSNGSSMIISNQVIFDQEVYDLIIFDYTRNQVCNYHCYHTTSVLHCHISANHLQNGSK